MATDGVTNAEVQTRNQERQETIQRQGQAGYAAGRGQRTIAPAAPARKARRW